MTNAVTLVATVMEVSVDPEFRDPLRRHLARIRVDAVVHGEPPNDRLTLLIHSPSKTFADPDPVGSSFVLSLSAPIDDPYTVSLEVSEDKLDTV